MRIYHYTTLDSLALILKNQTIRFTRLDKVDDLEEGKVQSNCVIYGKNAFVSCWMQDSRESLPMWNMYARGSAGVRIGLEMDMFVDYPVGDVDFQDEAGYVLNNPNRTTKLPIEEYFKEDYLFYPVLSINDKFFYRKVEYVKDINKAVGEIVQYKESRKIDDLMKVGTFKHKRWDFQKEYRFVLYAYPSNPNVKKGPLTDEVALDVATKSNELRDELPMDYFDLKIKPAVLDKIQIVLSPESSSGHRIIVESLCSSFLDGHHYTIKKSKLGECVKFIH